MNHLENHGLIIRELRRRSGLSVRKAAEKIGRAVGWLSEIENGKGTARLSEAEFERIVELFNGAQFRTMFRIWVANHKNDERKDKTFEGAVLKFIRKKKGLRLKEAAKLIGISYPQLSKLERGLKPMTLECRNRMLRAYGYQPSSFKNLATDPVTSKAVPSKYKVDVLLKQLDADQFEWVLQMLSSGRT